jgi:predicted ATPase
MINGFSVTNFRGFQQSGLLPLPPLTCLVGRNSSGKSSLIHALLILRQSSEQRAMGTRVSQLNLNGSLISAGSYDDIVHGHDDHLAVGFQFQVHVETDDVELRRVSKAPLIIMEVPRPPIYRQTLPMGREGRIAVRLTRALDVTVTLQFSPEPPFGPTLSRLIVEVPTLGKVTFTRTVRKRRIQHWRAYAEALPKNSVNILFPVASFLPFVVERSSRFGRLPQSERAKVSEFVAYARRATREIDSFLSQLRVLGPFRTPPARRYSFTGLAAVDTGQSGERAVDLLITEKLLRIPEQPLAIGVSYWLKCLGLAKRISIRDLARKANIFELAIFGAGSARTANFADVGFGVSQVLPVIVQGLLTPRSGTYVVQQPELHLHPDAQAGLADFFLYLASQGVRTIIETHSEYLLLRLRRRLAEGVKPFRIGLSSESETVGPVIDKSWISVVFVGEKRRSATLRRLEIGDSFQFDNLPKGFMSQAVDDRIALMRALK